MNAGQALEPPGRLLRLAPFVLLLGLLAHLATVAIWTPGLTALFDLEVYRAGGRAIIAGSSLYDGGVFGELRFTYPPFAAIVFTPLALLPVSALKLLFTAVNVAALCGCIWLSLRALGYRADGGLAMISVLLTGLLFWLEPVRSTIDIGQINLVLMLVLLWDLTRPEGSRWQGIGVGLAAGIKLIPGIFIGYLLITRRFRAAAVAAVVFLGTVALGFVVAPDDSVSYWRGTFLTTSRIGELAERGNQSLAGLLARLAEPAAPSTVGWLAGAVLLGGAGMAVAAWAHRGGNDLLGITMCGLTACAISPFTWNHHWVWFVPLIVLLAQLANAGLAPLALPVGLYLMLVDWPVNLPPADSPIPPPGGLMAIGVSGWPALLTRNLYLLAAVLAATLTVLVWARSLRGSARSVVR